MKVKKIILYKTDYVWVFVFVIIINQVKIQQAEIEATNNIDNKNCDKDEISSSEILNTPENDKVCITVHYE